tara:strand:+ start:2304 stop:2531 length:228 start_codon:yes stop_codon:yes gene_type:complete
MIDIDVLLKTQLDVGDEPEHISNPFSGETILLTPEEVAVHDLIKGSEFLRDYETVQAGCDWFRENNSKAYMVLLD